MVVKPCLTRVNVIIARSLLGASRQELFYLPDHSSQSGFPCLLTAGSLPILRSRGSLTCFSSFQLASFLPSLPPSHPPRFLSFIFFLLEVLFQLQDKCIVRKFFPCQLPSVKVVLLRQLGRCTNAQLPRRDYPKGMKGSRCVVGTFTLHSNGDNPLPYSTASNRTRQPLICRTAHPTTWSDSLSSAVLPTLQLDQAASHLLYSTSSNHTRQSLICRTAHPPTALDSLSSAVQHILQPHQASSHLPYCPPSNRIRLPLCRTLHTPNHSGQPSPYQVASTVWHRQYIGWLPNYLFSLL